MPPGAYAANAPIGQQQRKYGYDPDTVRNHVLAFARGMAPADVATTVRHFPGLGRVRGNTDITGGSRRHGHDSRGPLLRAVQRAIKGSVSFVMMSLATHPHIDPVRRPVFSPLVIDGLLRRDLHSDGVVVSDDHGTAVATASMSRLCAPLCS